MKILLSGRNGQVGWELERLLPELGEVVATDRSTFDLRNSDALRSTVRELKPDVILNAAAYTAVDQAESDRDLAMQVNGVAPGVLAEEASRLGALLVHYSTDYVFDGEKPEPYAEDDVAKPVNHYGRTKLAGEESIRRAGCRALIFRTSWVYSGRGKNFLLTVLRLAREHGELRIVADQRGAPTSARWVAQATVQALGTVLGPGGNRLLGLYHLSASGDTTWHGFASEIIARTGAPVRVTPIESADYPLPARRPRDSRLEGSKLYRAFGIRLPEWRQGLDECLAQLSVTAAAGRRGEP